MVWQPWEPSNGNQVAIMKSVAEEVVVVYDGDKAGMALKVIPMLEGVGLRVRIALVNEGMDPDDYIRKFGAERFRHVVETAVSTTKFKLIYLKKTIYC